MNRCLKSFSTPFRCIAGFALTAALVLPAAVQAESRPFPANALRGTLVVTAPPEVLLDGQPDRLAPGARIRDTQNLLALSATLVGQALTVNYRRDGAGLLHEIWILSAEEAREKRAGARSARNFLFGSEVNAAPRDDGRTPYHLLPGLPQR